jgi:hypothetical protein
MTELAGAVGDGITDDTAALQATLDQGGHIYLPAGTYRIAGTPLRTSWRTRLTLAPDATIVRAGAPGLIRNRHPDDDYPGYSGRGDILIEGGVWDMAGAAEGDTSLPASAMTWAHATGITVRDTVIRDVPGGHGMDLLGVQNVHIERVTFEGFAPKPGDTQPRESIQIDGCYSTISGDCEPIDATPCDDVTVRDCRFQASALLPAPERAVGSHGYANLVTGNEPRRIKVLDCTMDGCTDSAIYAWKWFESIISRNTIISPGKNGIVVQALGRDVDVEHNQIYDPGHSGVWVTDACDNIAVHGNRIIGASRAANNTHYGIRVSGGCTTCMVTDNRVRRRGDGIDARYGLSFGDGLRMYHHGNHLIWSGVTGSLQDLSTSPTTSAGDAL